MSTDILHTRQYGCDFCELRFKDATALKRHTNLKHTQEETHVCEHCAAVFYTKYKLDIHLASKHGINDQFKCDKCKKFLMSEWSLLKHKRKCSTNPCPVCGKEFLSKWKLGNHVKGHMNTRSHICDECGKDFLHSFTLVEHIEIVHQGKRLLNCNVCEKAFSRAGSLRTHKLIHTGVKPFPCPLCDKKCREKIQLIKHLQKKHDIEQSQLPSFVKMMPRKEIVKDENMQNLLQNIGQVKTELVDENVGPKNVNQDQILDDLKMEPTDEIVCPNPDEKSKIIETSVHPIAGVDDVSEEIFQPSMPKSDGQVKSDVKDMLDENAFIKEVYDRQLSIQSVDDTATGSVGDNEEEFDDDSIRADMEESLGKEVSVKDDLGGFMFESIAF